LLLPLSQVVSAQDDPVNNGLPMFRSSSGFAQSSAGSGLINVDHFTGTASATIPIYDYSIAGIDIGVSLSYDTRGIRVDQTASEVGLGWNLNAGGSITRVVHGLEDDQIFPGLGTTLGDGSRYRKPYRGFSASCYTGDCEAETELDVYQANFCGQSFRFSLKPNTGYWEWNSIPTDPKQMYHLKLYFLDSTGAEKSYYYGSSDIGGPKFQHASKHSYGLAFALLNDQGDCFKFKRGDYAQKLYAPPNVKPATGDPSGTIYDYTYYPTERWVLYSITTHSGENIKFNYTEYDNVTYMAGRDEMINEFKNATSEGGAYPW